jgi:hypothetical protein
MNKIVTIVAIVVALVASKGPAPNSGDGIPDGSGMPTQSAPQADNGAAPGPAPNSGDGIPDGSGF